MRLRARLADRRWSVFSNYDLLGIKSTREWFHSLGFAGNGRVTIIDLSMLAHEALPYVCATVGRVLLEARAKLRADKRFANPWVLVLEEAHNYARPSRQLKSAGKRCRAMPSSALPRKAANSGCHSSLRASAQARLARQS